MGIPVRHHSSPHFLSFLEVPQHIYVTSGKDWENLTNNPFSTLSYLMTSGFQRISSVSDAAMMQNTSVFIR